MHTEEKCRVMASLTQSVKAHICSINLGRDRALHRRDEHLCRAVQRGPELNPPPHICIPIFTLNS